MRRTILQDHNNGKALEVRLEQDGGTFYAILAGMTVNLHSGIVANTWDGSGPDDYYQIENDTYRSISFDSYKAAKATYGQFKQEFID